MLKPAKLFLPACALMLLSSSVLSASSTKTIQVIVDNSGTLQHVQEGLRSEHRLFYNLTELRKKSSYREALINVISLNNPRNIFEVTPNQLFRRGAELVPRLNVIKDGCSDIVGAFERVKENVRLKGTTDVEVYVFSSLIHTGAPCDNAVIELPQEAPKDLDLSFLKNAKVRFLWVHHLQKGPWLELLSRSGLLNFQLHDEEATKRVLREGLDE